MSTPIPVNALDKAVMAAQRSRSAFPDVCRALSEGELWLLIRFHPEITNQPVELKNGMPFPFLQIEEEHGTAVPVFSSEARAMEGLKKVDLPPRTYVPAVMPALQALDMLGRENLPMALNCSCATGGLTLPPNLLLDLANGSALEPKSLTGDRKEELRLDLIDPADYPTDLLQPVFELFRKHQNFRAAWIFTRTIEGQPKPEHVPYYLMVLMEPRDAAIFHDFNLVAQSSNGGHALNISLADEKDANQLAGLFQQARPFYLATGYQPPTLRLG